MRMVNEKILVAYYSRTGNTRAFANMIREKTGGDICEIVPEKPYPSVYDEATKQAKQELEAGARPKLKTKLDNIAQYDTVFVGYPMWWGTFPRPVFTFLSDGDFSGKKIVPFCTHEGSYLGHSVEDVKELCLKSTVLEALAIWDKDLKNSKGEIEKWLSKLGMVG